jgi:hypothetical protein
MAETIQLQVVSHPGLLKVSAYQQTSAKNNPILKKVSQLARRTREKYGEGSLHPRPKGRGIRDPPHSLCNKANSTYYLMFTNSYDLLVEAHIYYGKMIKLKFEGSWFKERYTFHSRCIRHIHSQYEFDITFAKCAIIYEYVITLNYRCLRSSS